MDQKKTYEAMFLLDAGTPDFEAAAEPVRKVLARSEAEILAFKPWDERRLAYTITGRKRGLYALTYFKVDPLRIVEIEHDCRLDERILRMLILRRDAITEDEINAETPATISERRAAERKVAKAAEEMEQAKKAEASQAEGVAVDEAAADKEGITEEEPDDLAAGGENDLTGEVEDER
jgi:small subunit ribosomal protein S6